MRGVAGEGGVRVRGASLRVVFFLFITKDFCEVQLETFRLSAKLWGLCGVDGLLEAATLYLFTYLLCCFLFFSFFLNIYFL